MEQILAAGGRPFRDVDAANIKCKSLSRELGDSVHCEVVPHPAGGFAIECREADLAPNAVPPLRVATQPTATVTRLPPPKALAMTSHPDVEWESSAAPRSSERMEAPAPKRSYWRSKAPNAAPVPAEQSRKTPPARTASAQSVSLGPAMRAFPIRWLMIVFGIALMFRPAWLLSWMRITPPADPERAVFVYTMISVLSLILVVSSLCFISWMYMSNSYVFDATGIQQVHWYRQRGSLWPRRRRPRVQYHQIRAITIDQSFLQAIMDVGHLRIASGGTDGYEVELRFVASPKRLERDIQARRLPT